MNFEMDPLDYMIEDCWLHLFKFLSLTDKQALCDTCETFYAMLQPQKTNWGFELILPQIAQYLVNTSRTEFKHQLSFSLELRLVCKSWRDGFDKFCTNWEHSGRIFTHIQAKNEFSNDIDVEKFLNFFKDFGGNPFINRRVEMFPSSGRHENSEEVEEEEGNEGERRNQERKRMRKYRKLIIELLTSYGKEIDHLYLGQRLYFSDIEYCSEQDAWKFLQLVLCKSPNLQRLWLNLRPLGLPAIAAESPDALHTALVQHLELNPLPEMPRLRELVFFNDRPKMEALLLETYGQSLGTLSITNSPGISGSLWGNMKCLRELTLTSEFTCFEQTLRAIQSPLQILSFWETFKGRKPSQFMIDKFLLAVQHLPLKKVTVKPVSKIVKEFAPFPRSFPKHATLETLKLKIRNPHSISLGFLFFLPNLKNWDLTYDGLESNTTKFQCPSYLRELK